MRERNRESDTSSDTEAFAKPWVGKMLSGISGHTTSVYPRMTHLKNVIANNASGGAVISPRRTTPHR